MAASARAQQQKQPVVGYLNSARERQYTHLTAVFRKGLAEGGYIEGQNVAVEYRWAEGDYTRLPALAADLVKRGVAVIVTHGPPAAVAAKAATNMIPIVFTSGDDPVRSGLVSSISRPGGNVTGVTLVVSLVLTKRLGMMHELVPGVRAMATLLNPNSNLAEPDRAEVTAAAKTLGIDMHVLEAATEPISTRRLPSWPNGGSVRSWSAPIRFTTPGETNSSHCPRSTRFRPCIRSASSPPPAA